MSSGFSYDVACIRISFFSRLNSIPLYTSSTFCLPTHLSVDRRVASWLLWIMLLWTWLCICSISLKFCFNIFIYPQIEWLGHMIILLLVFWETTMYSTIFHSHQQGIRVPVFSHPHPHFFILFFIVMNMRWYLTMILICISLMVRDIDCLFICLLTISISSLESCLLGKKVLRPFLIRLFVVLFVVES